MVRDNEGMISLEEVEGWDQAYKRPDVRRIRVGKDPKDWPSNQPASVREQKQRGAIWQYLLTIFEDLEVVGYTRAEVQRAVDDLLVMYASGDSDDDDIIDADARVHPDGPPPLDCYLYQVRYTYDHSRGLGPLKVRPQRVRFEFIFDPHRKEKKDRGEFLSLIHI